MDLAGDPRMVTAQRVARMFKMDPLAVLRATTEEWALRASATIAAGRDLRNSG